MKSPDLSYILNGMRQQSTTPNAFAAAMRFVSSTRTAESPSTGSTNTPNSSASSKENVH